MKRTISGIHIILAILLFSIPVNAVNIIQVEYFIDEDPGIGEATAIEIEAGESIDIAEDIEISELENGFHVLYVRAAQAIEEDDEAGVWSHTFLQPFLKTNIDRDNAYDLLHAEWFINEDPGRGEANSIEFEADVETNLAAVLDIEEFENGFHVLYVRSAQEDENGDMIWSHTYMHPFLKMNTDQQSDYDIVYAEYFIDEDPGRGEAAAIEIDAGAELMLEDIVGLDELANGFHVLYLRTVQEDAGGNHIWSHTYIHPFLKMNTDQQSDYEVVYAEYFIDEDPGRGEAVELEIQAGADVLIEDIIGIDQLDNGFHTLYLRTAQEDEDGTWVWSLTHIQPFFKQPHDQDNIYDIVCLEYYVDEDPGMGEGIDLQMEEDTEVIYNDYLDIEELEDGDHVLFLRAAQLDENENQVWTHTFAHDFFKRDTNAAPGWTDYPESQEIVEGELLEFRVTGEDPDDEYLTIFAQSEELPDGWSFTDNGDGTGDFSWRPGFGDDGVYVLFFILTDGEHRDAIDVEITVINLNHPPEVRNPIGDEIETEEDAGRLEIADLSEVFYDEDPDDNITYEVLTIEGEPVPDYLNMAIDDENTLYMEPEEHANLGEEGLQIEVICDDGREIQDDERRLMPVFGSVTVSRETHSMQDTVRSLRSTNEIGTQLSTSSSFIPHPSSLLHEVSPRRDAAVSDYFTLYLTPINDAPEWTEVPDDQAVDEGDEIQFSLTADDVDFDYEGDEITLSMVDDDGTADRGAEFTDNGDNTGTFTWQTDFDDEGDYDLVFEVEDRAGETAMAGVHVTVAHVNVGPEIAEPIGDQEYAEDSGPWEIVDLDDVFLDHDADELVFTVNVEEPLTAEVDDERHVLTLASPENFNGEASVTVTAEDDPDERRLMVSLGGVQTRLERGFESARGDHRSLRGTSETAVRGLSIPGRDLSIDDVFNVTITPVNDAPIIGTPTEEDSHQVEIQETEELTIQFSADDADHDSDELRWSVAVEDGLPEGWEFIDNEDGSAEFVWTPTFADAGEYEPIFRVTDPDEATDELPITINIIDRNRAPVIDHPIPDHELIEDAERNVLVDLDTVFVDPDEDDVLFTLLESPGILQLEIDGENLLSILSMPDYWVDEPGLLITVRASDPEDASIVDSFYVTVLSVNDRPEPFNLLTPADELNVPYNPDSLGTLDFTWQVADQNEYEIDTVTYSIEFWVEDQNRFRVGFVDTETYPNIPIQMLADSLEIERWDPITFNWQVWAVDSGDSTLATEAPWTFTTPALGVDSDPELGIPDDYYLSPNFPNPFNASTTIRFGLSVSGVVDIMISDIYGRRIETLVSDNYSTGHYRTVWNAAEHPSGVYLVQMRSGEFITHRKVMLIR